MLRRVFRVTIEEITWNELNRGDFFVLEEPEWDKVPDPEGTFNYETGKELCLATGEPFVQPTEKCPENVGVHTEVAASVSNNMSYLLDWKEKQLAS